MPSSKSAQKGAIMTSETNRNSRGPDVYDLLNDNNPLVLTCMCAFANSYSHSTSEPPTYKES